MKTLLIATFLAFIIGFSPSVAFAGGKETVIVKRHPGHHWHRHYRHWHRHHHRHHHHKTVIIIKH